jgi:hypothetical protein
VQVVIMLINLFEKYRYLKKNIILELNCKMN